MSLRDFFNASKIKEENEHLRQQINDLGVTEYAQTKQKIAALEQDANVKLSRLNQDISLNTAVLSDLREQISVLQD